MKKLFLFLLPIFTYAQITKAYNDNLGEHIGLHIIYFLGRVNGGVSLSKLPDGNGREYHQLIWTNKDYDEEEERTILTFQSTSEDINNLFKLFNEVIKIQKTKIVKLEDKVITIIPSSIKNQAIFHYESDGVNKYFYISSTGIYELFGKTWNRIEKSTKAKPQVNHLQ